MILITDILLKLLNCSKLQMNLIFKRICNGIAPIELKPCLLKVKFTSEEKTFRNYLEAHYDTSGSVSIRIARSWTKHDSDSKYWSRSLHKSKMMFYVLCGDKCSNVTANSKKTVCFTNRVILFKNFLWKILTKLWW